MHWPLLLTVASACVNRRLPKPVYTNTPLPADASNSMTPSIPSNSSPSNPSMYATSPNPPTNAGPSNPPTYATPPNPTTHSTPPNPTQSPNPSTDSSQFRPGISTRYWDCAKPHCAWTGNLLTQLGSVKSCALDGVTVLPPDARSISDGGQATACFNQQPVIDEQDPNLAYGFVAALDPQFGTDVPSNLKKTCCACVELRFTSGLAQGKRMIAQVINTGYDLKPSDLGVAHFDIQIPGGGDGLMSNNCGKQFNINRDQLGSQYGGIKSIDDIKFLPPALQPGAKFRFTWLGDNPDLQFRYVQCPKRITDISGCINQGL